MAKDSPSHQGSNASSASELQIPTFSFDAKSINAAEDIHSTPMPSVHSRVTPQVQQQGPVSVVTAHTNKEAPEIISRDRDSSQMMKISIVPLIKEKDKMVSASPSIASLPSLPRHPNTTANTNTTPNSPSGTKRKSKVASIAPSDRQQQNERQPTIERTERQQYFLTRQFSTNSSIFQQQQQQQQKPSIPTTPAKQSFYDDRSEADIVSVNSFVFATQQQQQPSSSAALAGWQQLENIANRSSGSIGRFTSRSSRQKSGVSNKDVLVGTPIKKGH
ncbi:hypothetical protein HK100_006549, partial [Physocladia obscura]